MKKAIVISCGVNGLGVIRSIGLKGFRILALYYDSTSFAHKSKYVHKGIKIPHPILEERQFIQSLLDNSEEWEGSIVFDAGDVASIGISKNKQILSKHYKIVSADWNVLNKFIDKPETYKLAQSCGVPYPRTFFPQTLEEVENIQNKISYPSIIKPVRGHEFMANFNVKSFKVKDYSGLLSKFRLCFESGLDVMIQEVIQGPDSNVYECEVYIDRHGELSAAFMSRKLRQNPPQFGVARAAVSEELIPEIKEYTEKILKQANFRGIAHIEFKKDPRDNSFKLLEINGRTQRSNWLPTCCGVNFPWIAYKDLVEREIILVKDYNAGVYWIDVYQDIINSVFRSGEEKIKFQDYLKPYLSKSKTFAVMSFSDFMPSLKQISTLPTKYYRYFGFLRNKPGSLSYGGSMQWTGQ